MKTPAKKAGFIKGLIDNLSRKASKSVAKKVMFECGYMMRDGVSRCINENKIKRTKKLYTDSKNIKDFVTRLSKQGGGNLKSEGNTIEATYDRCYCGSVSRTKERIALTPFPWRT
jgi:hypothetical protein